MYRPAGPPPTMLISQSRVVKAVECSLDGLLAQACIRLMAEHTKRKRMKAMIEVIKDN
jgi:hypothetical protein